MPTKISFASNRNKQYSHDYTRVVLTENPPSSSRFVEKSDGTTEYRQGVGKWTEVKPRTFRNLVRTAVQSLKSHKIEKAILDIDYKNFPGLHMYDEMWFGSTLAENLSLAAYEFTTYKSKPDSKHTLQEAVVTGLDSVSAKAGFIRGITVAHYINKARDIANTQSDDMTPKHLAAVAKKMAAGSKVAVKVLGLAEIKKQKLNLLAAVGKGSHLEPQFIVMEFKGAKSKKEAPIVLVGKGITYDTGGLNVKPAGHMHEEHMDMSGGGAVMAAIVASAKLGIQKNIVALIPAAENAISSHSMRAGDIVTSHSGITVEILHTDAEGRLILADALSYSTRFKPRAIIDVATLTGASLAALGQHASAVMTRHTDLENTLRTLGEESGDLVWPLPLWDEYRASLKSSRADISNIATNFSRFGGCIEGGVFLSHFVDKNIPWAHIDIAPRMESIPSDKLAKGSTGEPVRLLVKFIEQY